MHEMTSLHLRNAYSGESMAHMRYKVWGNKAEEDGYPNVARLFRAISAAEQVHATNHFTELKNAKGAQSYAGEAPFGLSTTSENLQGGIDGEDFEIEEMYPVYLNTAEFQDERGARLSFHYALSAEKIHSAMFQKAKQKVDQGSDIELGPVRICDKCGYTVEGDIPDKCPVCGVGPERFQSFE